MSIYNCISEIRLFKHLTLKMRGQGHGWGKRSRSQHPFDGLPFRVTPIDLTIPKIWPEECLTKKNRAKILKKWLGKKFKQISSKISSEAWYGTGVYSPSLVVFGGVVLGNKVTSLPRQWLGTSTQDIQHTYVNHLQSEGTSFNSFPAKMKSVSITSVAADAVAALEPDKRNKSPGYHGWLN